MQSLELENINGGSPLAIALGIGLTVGFFWKLALKLFDNNKFFNHE